jgi:hypothetical protein
MVDNDTSVREFDERRQRLYTAYIMELAGATKDVPGEEKILEELEELRNRLKTAVNRIRSADEEQLRSLYDQFADELLKLGGRLPTIRFRSRAAILLAGAAEADQKATTFGKVRDWNELSRLVRNSKTQDSFIAMDPFVRYAIRTPIHLPQESGRKLRKLRVRQHLRSDERFVALESCQVFVGSSSASRISAGV